MEMDKGLKAWKWKTTQSFFQLFDQKIGFLKTGNSKWLHWTLENLMVLGKFASQIQFQKSGCKNVYCWTYFYSL